MTQWSKSYFQSCYLLIYRTKISCLDTVPSSALITSHGAYLGNILLYSGRQTVSCCFIGALNRHFIVPCSPTLSIMFPSSPCFVISPAGLNHYIHIIKSRQLNFRKKKREMEGKKRKNDKPFVTFTSSGS